MKNLKTILLPCLLALALAAVAQQGAKTSGYASYYHDQFEGRKTANGEIFRQEKLTCAHRTLPFGTLLEVTNLGNGKTVLVRVNDRGPFVSHRIVDLSRAAAKKLDFITAGETKVTIEIVNEPAPDTILSARDSVSPFLKVEMIEQLDSGYTVQVAAYGSNEAVFDMMGKIKQELDCETFVQVVSRRQGLIYRVFAGHFATREDAEAWMKTIDVYYPGCFLVEIK